MLCLALNKFSLSLAFYPEIVPYFKEFCLQLDPLLKDQVQEEKSLIAVAGLTLKKLSLNSYVTAREKADVEKALLSLHEGICKCLIIRFQSKIAVFSLKKHNKQQLIEAIQTFESRFSSDSFDNIGMINRALSSLLISDLGSYYKPSRDPLKIKLLYALELLCKSV